MSKTVVFYHANCWDGLTAAWVLSKPFKFLTEDLVFKAVQYGEAPQFKELLDDLDVKRCFILDFSWPMDVMLNLVKNWPAVDFIWIDHHKSAIESYYTTRRGLELRDCFNFRTFLSADNTKSGARLTYDYFSKPGGFPVAYIVDRVSDRDTWQFVYGDSTRRFHAYLSSMPMTFDTLDSVIETNENQIYFAGEAIIRYQESLYEQILKLAEPCEFAGESGLCVSCLPSLASEVGNRLAAISGTYGACYTETPEGRVNISLRSRGKYDVSTLAKKFGGGGHKNAAGFTIGNQIKFRGL